MTNPTSNRKTVPDFFGRLYPQELVNGSFLGTWVRRAEVDALLDEIERLRAALERIESTDGITALSMTDPVGSVPSAASGTTSRIGTALESIWSQMAPLRKHQ